ncbi:hypothetical protein T4D_10687 [Trichinella pseudospiralis]|uniref:Uncharacterized protein n=1 Tax=Trichinella pseudospiralis TaxID=6337 RepID=A0A0V1F6B4_TRIPS|nr:hypothetical protein T4D_10687 [Trichinella pseudospiralis]
MVDDDRQVALQSSVTFITLRVCGHCQSEPSAGLN